MELTIEQALQQGVAAHKEGKLQDAERLYRVILQSQPLHPDANHNLGLIAVSVNKVDAALPLFKVALEANPKIEQFWLSYIDALIKEKQFDNANQVLEQAKNQGVVGEKLNVLESQLRPTAQVNEFKLAVQKKSLSLSEKRKKLAEEKKRKKAKKQNLKATSPSESEIKILLGKYQNGQHADAEKLALSITERFPKHQLAWKILGAVLGQSGRNSEAVNANQSAIALSPQDAQAHNNLGITLKELGRLEEAEACYRQSIALQPTLAEAHSNLGITLQELGRLNEAEASFRKAISLKPIFPYAHSNLGITLKELGRFEGAEASYKQAIALKPDYVEAHNNLGVALKELGRFEEAEASYTQAIALKPDYAEPHSNLGLMLMKLGRLDEAETSYRQAIALKPDYAVALSNLGNTLKELGRLNEAEASYRQAIGVKSDLTEAYNNLGVMLKGLGRLDESEACLGRAIASKPDFAEAHSNLGNTLKELGRFEEAEASYTQAMALKPDFAEAHSNLLFLYSGYSYDTSLYLKEAHDYGRRRTEAVTSQFSNWLCEEEHQALRVGFVSGDLSNHPVGYFLEGLLNELGGSKLALFAYPTKLLEDELTVRIKPHFAAWRPLVGIGDEAAANLIHSDGIHILIDLSGHTAGNRLPIFAWKPAPVQISWLGYFASSGVTEIDYILGDPYVTPIEEAGHFTEKIWRLPESYLCFTQPNVDVDVAPLPALTNGSVTFGCFNKIERINDDVVAVWARILKAIPDSKLFLKDKKLSNDSMRDAVYRRFEFVGIGRGRLILEGSSPRSEYLASYNRVDIALSPFPYGGGTTSAEGLWMGVPVIAKRGNHFLSHLGESIAHNTGLSEWIASDQDDYVAKAIEYSSNLDGLAKLRLRLREQVLYSPLFDRKRFASHFETALRGVWNTAIKNNNKNAL